MAQAVARDMRPYAFRLSIPPQFPTMRAWTTTSATARCCDDAVLAHRINSTGTRRRRRLGQFTATSFPSPIPNSAIRHRDRRRRARQPPIVHRKSLHEHPSRVLGGRSATLIPHHTPTGARDLALQPRAHVPDPPGRRAPPSRAIRAGDARVAMDGCATHTAEPPTTAEHVSAADVTCSQIAGREQLHHVRGGLGRGHSSAPSARWCWGSGGTFRRKSGAVPLVIPLVPQPGPFFFPVAGRICLRVFRHQSGAEQ